MMIYGLIGRLTWIRNGGKKLIPSSKLESLIELSEIITSAPKNFVLGRQVKKVFDDRKLMASGKAPINWGFAESMAYASLLSEGYPIRLTGQDVRRGTFSHRHAAIYNQQKMVWVIYR